MVDMKPFKPSIPDDLLEPDMVAEVSVFDPDVEGQQIELVYTQAFTAIIGAFILACLVVGGLWPIAEQNYLVIWLAAQSVQTVLRLGLVLAYRGASDQERSSSKWMAMFFAGALLAGIIWGCIGLIFSFSWPLEYQVFTLLSLVGIVSGAISSYAAMMSIYIAFMLPCILIPAQSMLVYSSNLQANIGLILMLFAGVLIIIARNYNKNVVKSLQLRTENQSLVNSMRITNDKLLEEVRVREISRRA